MMSRPFPFPPHAQAPFAATLVRRKIVPAVRTLLAIALFPVLASSAFAGGHEPGAALLRINAGGPQLEIAGETWLEDRYFDGGTHYVAPEDLSITGTDREAIYRSERFATDELGSFAYRIPVDEPGDFVVRLHFAEIWFGAPDGGEGEPGRRVFDVRVDGGEDLEALDLVDLAGPLAAFAWDVTVRADAEIVLTFDARVDRPKVSGIEVFRLEEAVADRDPEPQPDAVDEEALERMQDVVPDAVAAPLDALRWFDLEPEGDSGVRGSLLLRDRGTQTIAVVLVSGTDAGTVYDAAFAIGSCGDPVAVGASVALVRGISGYGTATLPVSLDAILAEGYRFVLRTPDGVSVACGVVAEAQARD